MFVTAAVSVEENSDFHFPSPAKNPWFAFKTLIENLFMRLNKMGGAEKRKDGVPLLSFFPNYDFCIFIN